MIVTNSVSVKIFASSIDDPPVIQSDSLIVTAEAKLLGLFKGTENAQVPLLFRAKQVGSPVFS